MKAIIRRWLGIDTDIENAAMIARAEVAALRSEITPTIDSRVKDLVTKITLVQEHTQKIVERNMQLDYADLRFAELRDQQAANALQAFERLNKQDDTIQSLNERTREQYADIVKLQNDMKAHYAEMLGVQRQHAERSSNNSKVVQEIVQNCNERLTACEAYFGNHGDRLLALERKAEDRTPRAASINRLRAMISEQGGIKDNLPSEVAS